MIHSGHTEMEGGDLGKIGGEEGEFGERLDKGPERGGDTEMKGGSIHHHVKTIRYSISSVCLHVCGNCTFQPEWSLQ